MTEDELRIAYKEKLRSLGFSATKAGPKRTVDAHDTHTVVTTESGSDRVDVTVQQLKPVKLNGPKVNGG